MKNSKKYDFKKLALLGITGGAVLTTQTVEAEILNPSQLLAASCASTSGCRGNQGMGNNGGSYQAYRSVPSQNYYYTDGQYSGGQYASCGGASPQYYPSSSGGTMPQYYQQSNYPQQNYQQSNYPQQSYGAPMNYSQQSWSSSSCGGAMPQNSYQTYSQQSQSCGGATIAEGQPMNIPSTNPSTNSSNTDQNNGYSQWETGGYISDNNKTTQTRTTTTQQESTMQQNKGSHKMMTETELLSQLNEDGKKTYNSLDTAGKALALKMASQDTFKDKNLAVKAAALKMSEKRSTPASSKY